MFAVLVYVLIAVLVVGALIFVWSLCCISARADERAERIQAHLHELETR